MNPDVTIQARDVDPELWVRFVNTELIQAGERVDTLATEGDVYEWARRNGLIEDVPGDQPGLRSPGEAGLEATRQFRAELRTVGRLIGEGRDPEEHTLTILNTAMGWSSLGFTIGWQSGEAAPNRMELAESLAITGRGLSPILSLVALSAVRFLVGGSARRLKQCASDSCILYFVDTTKNRSRRWCSMQTCGNRDKVKAHYHRTRR